MRRVRLRRETNGRAESHRDPSLYQKRITTKPNEMKTKRDDDDETYNNNAIKLVKTFIDEPYNRTGFTFAVRTDDDFDDAVNGGDNSELVVLDGKRTTSGGRRRSRVSSRTKSTKSPRRRLWKLARLRNTRRRTRGLGLWTTFRCTRLGRAIWTRRRKRREQSGGDSGTS